MALIKESYREILESLSALEALLHRGGLQDDQLERLRFHSSQIQQIEVARLAGNLDGIDRDQTLWSLIESTEFADIYRGMSTYDPRSLAEKFKLILKGPDHPSSETDATNGAEHDVLAERGVTASRWRVRHLIASQSGYSVQTVGRRGIYTVQASVLFS